MTRVLSFFVWAKNKKNFCIYSESLKWRQISRPCSQLLPISSNQELHKSLRKLTVYVPRCKVGLTISVQCSGGASNTPPHVFQIITKKIQKYFICQKWFNGSEFSSEINTYWLNEGIMLVYLSFVILVMNQSVKSVYCVINCEILMLPLSSAVHRMPGSYLFDHARKP